MTAGGSQPVGAHHAGAAASDPDGGRSKRRRDKRRGRAFIIGLFIVTGVLMLALPQAMSSARLVWNVSPSAPAGLYWIEYGGWTRGDRVAVRPGKELSLELQARGVIPAGRLLIKRVAGSEGDRVCRRGTTVSVNGVAVAEARAVDGEGRSLPDWQGCVRLRPGEVFLLGDGPASYDGRYFGPTPASEVMGSVRQIVGF